MKKRLTFFLGYGIILLEIKKGENKLYVKRINLITKGQKIYFENLLTFRFCCGIIYSTERENAPNNN